MTHQRDKPSKKAKEQSAIALRDLFVLLHKLTSCYPYRKNREAGQIDFKGWKIWIIRYTPSDKRGK